MNTIFENPQKAVQHFAASALQQGFELESLQEYLDEQGNPLYWRPRLKHPQTGEKWIRPMCRDNNSYSLKEPVFPQGKPLYHLDQLTKRANEVVFVCEGEKCADVLLNLGLLATTSGAANSAEKANWQPLANRNIIIWPDNDEAGQRYAISVADALKYLNCHICIIDVEQLSLPPKGDVVDWLKLYPNKTKEDIMTLPVIEAINHQDDTEDEESSEKKSQASLIVEYVLNQVELFHDKNADVYAQDKITHETYRLDGRQFKDWLVSSFYENTDKSPREQSLREAISTLSGLARYKSECKNIYIRVGQLDDKYYLDLGQPGNSRVIEIIAGSWSVIDKPPIDFLRSNTLQPLPEPVLNQDLSILWEVINIPEDSRLLVVAWLIECLRIDTPFPLLELIGEQGSAKSTTQTILRQLFDPNACDLRASPKVVDDIFVSAGLNWLLSYENLSYLSSAMQDALCMVATGGGSAKRRLYTDADESVINVKRPIILNGISAVITAQDLVDRTLSVELPSITARQEITSLRVLFQENHGKLLGTLLTIMGNALKILPEIKLPEKDKPRLIEFAKLGMAVAQAMGQPSENFLIQFNRSRQESIARTLDASPVASALMDWIANKPQKFVRMAAKDLFKEITEYKSQNIDAWPRSPKGFADAMRRAAPALRQVGIFCVCTGKTGGNVYWEISARE